MTATLVDTHVHFHQNFRLEVLLESVRQHLAQANSHSGLEVAAACLVSTQIGGGDPLAFLRRRESSYPPSWAALDTNPDSVTLTRQGEPLIVVLSGKQIVTREGLEVLALASSAPAEDRASLEETIRAILEGGGVPVLPWGFGKWTGRRGALVDELLGDAFFSRVIFLGDSGCRPRGLGRPRRLRHPASGCRVLAGSDPLPFADHERRPASYASLLPDSIDWHQPALWLRSQLSSLRDSPTIVGRSRSTHRFFHDQLRMVGRRWATT